MHSYLSVNKSSKIRADKEQSLEPPSSPMITSLPDDIIVDILARVPRCNYPALSLVSKHFRSLVVSPEIYARRSLLGCTEACIYGYLSNLKTYRFYILRRNANSNNRFVLIPSIPAMPKVRCLVAVGWRIYVFGEDMTSSSFAIDCRSHTVHPLPMMPIPMASIVADVIDEKIYVIGQTTNEELKNVVVVFNTETQMWDPEVTKTDKDLSGYWCYKSVAIAGKIYMRNLHRSFVYGPKENKWETDEMLNSMICNYPCVIDDVMYYYDIENELRAYDPKNKCWRVVKGVGEFCPEGTTTYCSNTVSYGGKLAVLLPKKDKSKTSIEFLFAEIAIERLQGGEISGKVECCDLVCENIFLVKPGVVMV